MTHYSFEYPKFEVKVGDEGIPILNIVDFIKDNDYNNKQLGRISYNSIPSGSSVKYNAVANVVDRLLKDNWTVTIESNTKSIFLKSRHNTSFKNTLQIKAIDTARHTLSEVRLKGETLTISLETVHENFEWLAAIDISSITSIKAECIPLKIKNACDHSLGEVLITPHDESGCFKVEMNVIDHRILSNIVDYHNNKTYANDHEFWIQISEYSSSQSPGRSTINLIKGIKGLALAIHLTNGNQDKSFPPALNELFYAGLDSKYMFSMRGDRIELISQRSLLDAMDCFDRELTQ